VRIANTTLRSACVVLIALRACRLSEALGQCLYDLQGRKLANLAEAVRVAASRRDATSTRVFSKIAEILRFWKKLNPKILDLKD